MANDLRVHSVSALLPPSCVVEEQPADADVYARILGFRESLLDILAGASSKFLVILAPCGMPEDLLQAARSAQAGELGASAKVQLIIQPIMRHNERRNQAVAQHRDLLLQLNAMGLPASAAFDDTITPQYSADLLTHASVPAEAAMMRELVSGLSMPAGLCSDATCATRAYSSLQLASRGHHFLGASSAGLCGIVESSGNGDTHAILRFDLQGGGPKDAQWASRLVQAVVEAVEAEVSRSGVRAWIADLDLDAGECLGASQDDAASAARLVIAELCERLGGVSRPCPVGAMALRGVRISYRGGSSPEGQGRPVWGSAQVAELLAPLVQHAGAAMAAHGSARMAPRATRPGSGPCDNLRIRSVRPLLPAAILLEELPRLSAHELVVQRGRDQIQQILSGSLDRLLVVCGPPLVDDLESCTEFAARLAALATKVAPDLLLVMRCQVVAEPEQPSGPGIAGQTAGGRWPGCMMDPSRDGSFRINAGLRSTRELLLRVCQLGLPIACEFYDTITPQYISDLLSWSAVPAASATLRQLVSGLSMPAGFRTCEADASVLSQAAEAQTFVGVTTHGIAGIVRATGNLDCALQLPFSAAGEREVPIVGGDATPTSDATTAAVSGSHLRPTRSASSPGVRLVLEAGGEGVGPEEQLRALGAIVDLHISQADTSVRGVCLSSFLVSGCQTCHRSGGAAGSAVPIPLPVPGLSLGEPCLGWERTEEAVRLLAEAVRAGRRAREEAYDSGVGTEGGKRQKT